MAISARTRLGWMVSGAAISALAAQASTAATLYVTNDGADAGSCGSKVNPCRSISQAINNASPGDTIGVGAGRYGDISGDGTFSHPGDEQPQPGTETACMICITKPLQIYSLHGASVTIIEGVPGAGFPINVLIASYGVRFGTEGAGFTVTGGNNYGVRIDQDAIGNAEFHPPGASISIAGNVDVGDGTAFSFKGIDFRDNICRAPVPCEPAQVTFSGNQAIANSGTGFEVVLNAQIRIAGGGPVILRNNVARGAGTGFVVHPGFQDEIGEAVSAGNVSLFDNLAVHGGWGFDLDLAGDIERNTASGNADTGFLVVPNRSVFRGNSSIGNAGPGLIVSFSADFFDGGTDPSRQFQTLAQNNFYGNDRGRPPLTLGNNGAQLNPGPSAHCGILNVGALATLFGPAAVTPPPKEPVQAVDDFWGTPAGPSFSGVGDAIGGACDQNGGVTTAPKPYPLQSFGITAF